MSMERGKSLEPCPAGAEELAEINRFARTPLTAEEVYCFAVRLCDSEVDRDFERFDAGTLSALGDLFVGKTGLFDHRWSAEGQTARIYRTELVTEPETKTAAGDSYCWLKGWAYLLRTEGNRELIREIEGGIKKEVSVGCSVRRSAASAPSAGRRAAAVSTRRASATAGSSATGSCGRRRTPMSGPSWRCPPSGRRAW